MRSAVKTPLAGLNGLAGRLREIGCEVCDAPDGYRILMYRRDEPGWTQGYTGSTRTGRVRSFIRWAGPETNILEELK